MRSRDISPLSIATISADLYRAFHSRVTAGPEGRVRGHGRQPGKIERSRYRCLPWRARQGWLARRWRPLDLSAIPGRAATYRPLDASPRGQPAAARWASRPRGEPTIELGV